MSSFQYSVNYPFSSLRLQKCPQEIENNHKVDHELSKMKIPKTAAKKSEPTTRRLVTSIIYKNRKTRIVENSQSTSEDDLPKEPGPTFLENNSKQIIAQPIPLRARPPVPATVRQLNWGPGLGYSGPQSAFRPTRPIPRIAPSSLRLRDIQRTPYYQRLYRQVVMETEAYERAANPPIDMFLNQLNQVAARVRLPVGVYKAFERGSEGEVLFRQVTSDLPIEEREYFSFCFYDKEEGIRHWLYNDKKILKQLKNLPQEFSFEVKFYPTTPTTIVDDHARYYVFLQLRRDILTGRLPATADTHALHGSFKMHFPFALIFALSSAIEAFLSRPQPGHQALEQYTNSLRTQAQQKIAEIIADLTKNTSETYRIVSADSNYFAFQLEDQSGIIFRFSFNELYKQSAWFSGEDIIMNVNATNNGVSIFVTYDVREPMVIQEAVTTNRYKLRRDPLDALDASIFVHLIADSGATEGFLSFLVEANIDHQTVHLMLSVSIIIIARKSFMKRGFFYDPPQVWKRFCSTSPEPFPCRSENENVAETIEQRTKKEFYTGTESDLLGPFTMTPIAKELPKGELMMIYECCGRFSETGTSCFRPIGLLQN
uniref:FERM domain-containing protein n=1 Tax=Caenorhabditis japonica TaxID=281687 RepID=A0A8R1HRW4_CAEJA